MLISQASQYWPRLTRLATELPGAAIAAGVAIAGAVLVHLVVFRVLTRVARISHLESDELVVDRLRGPVRWALVAVALELAGGSSPLLGRIWGAVDRFVIPALLGWIAIRLIKAYALAVDSRAMLEEDDLAARSRRTRIAILSRSLRFVIVLITVALMLMSIPGVRTIGVTLITSAGLAALAVGAAAQPALKSLIAGIQMALTQPIRIDDHVVIDGEGGRVEDIRLTYVVIRSADERRIIVPTAKFLDTTFQNWTRVSGGITGSATLAVQPGTEVAPIRAAYLDLLARRPEWDRRTGALQVSDAKADAIELKLVMSAADPGTLAALRLGVREELLEWLRQHMPAAVAPPAAGGLEREPPVPG